MQLMEVSTLVDMSSLMKKKHGIGVPNNAIMVFLHSLMKENKRKLARDHYSTFINT